MNPPVTGSASGSATPSATDIVTSSGQQGNSASATPTSSGGDSQSTAESSPSPDSSKGSSPSPSEDAATTASPSPSSSRVDAYTPTQTNLVIQTYTPSSSNEPSSATNTPSPTLQAPAIPSNVAPRIVPQGNEQPQPPNTALISILLNLNTLPWSFVYGNPESQSQIFIAFPKLLSNALDIPITDVRNVALQIYQPAGKSDQFGTQWLGYIPQDQFSTLEAYISTPSSPLYNQTGLAGQVAAQIDPSYPITSYMNKQAQSNQTAHTEAQNDKRKRNIIIGVCVGVGGALWAAISIWIYKRLKRSNERAVNKRLSEHMSMFSGQSGGAAANPFQDNRRVSATPSIAASEIDSRPSSFYASPLDNYPAMRRRQVETYYSDQAAASGAGGAGDQSPTSYVNSVFGTSWFQNSTYGGTTGHSQTGHSAHGSSSPNPFDDVYARSSPSQQRMSLRPQRRSIQKTMISQPTLQANSLEFNEYNGYP